MTDDGGDGAATMAAARDGRPRADDLLSEIRDAVKSTNFCALRRREVRLNKTMSTIALDCRAVGFEEAGGGDPVFVLEVATALRYEGEALRWPLRCTYAQVDRLHILCYQLEPELRIIEFPKPAGTGFFKSLHTKSADRGSKVAKWVMALVARPELSAEVQTELLRFLGVYDDGRLPDGMLLWATPDASGRNRDSSRPSMRQLEKHGSRSSRVASQRDDARRAGATIVSEGYLYKMAISSSNQAWRRRYFVLSANGLFAYYASKTATAPKGVIMLSPDFYVADSLNRQFGFQLSDFTQTFYMAAECAARAIPRRAQFIDAQLSDAPPALLHAPLQVGAREDDVHVSFGRCAQGPRRPGGERRALPRYTRGDDGRSGCGARARHRPSGCEPAGVRPADAIKED